MRRRSLPQVVIPVPCRVEWNTMMPIDRAGRARFCDSCERPVYDSAALTRDELFDLIARTEGQRLPCVRLHRRPDGTIVTRDCFAPVVRVGRFLWLKVGVAAVAFWATALGLRELGRSLNEHAAYQTGGRVMGRGVFVRRAPCFPARPAALRPNVAPPKPTPRLGIRALLPEIEPASPLQYLEADEDIHKRLGPDAGWVPPQETYDP